MDYQADQLKAKAFLFKIVSKQAGEKGTLWLEQQRIAVEKEAHPKKLFMAFSMASRFFSKDPLYISEKDLKEADEIRSGFQPAGLNLLQAARIYLLLLLPAADQAAWFEAWHKLFETADMHEQEALYAALPLMPYPQMLTKQAAEGIRTNITPVFDAVALENPYPADFLPQDAWNQMVLKAVFMQRPLYKINKAGERANAELTQMLIDFSRERRAAGRKVVPELWYLTGRFLTGENFGDIERVVREGETVEREAALLACSMSTLPAAKQLLEEHPDIKEAIITGKLNRKEIGERHAAAQKDS